MGDPVDHPSHYNKGPVSEDGTAKFEVVKLIEDLGWGYEFCMGNALKYTLRAPYKGNQTEDLKKARFYLNRAIKHAGRVRAGAFRKLATHEAIGAWDLSGRLALVMESIMEGDPVGALEHLNVFMFRIEQREEA